MTPNIRLSQVELNLVSKLLMWTRTGSTFGMIMLYLVPVDSRAMIPLARPIETM